MDPINPYAGIFNVTGWANTTQTDVADAEKIFSRGIKKFIKPLLDYLMRERAQVFHLPLESEIGNNLDTMIKEKLSNPKNKSEKFLKHVFDKSPNAFTHFKNWLLTSVKYFCRVHGTSSETHMEKFKNERVESSTKLFLQSVKNCEPELFNEAAAVSAKSKTQRRKGSGKRTIEGAKKRFGFGGQAAQDAARAPKKMPRAEAPKPVETDIPNMQRILKTLRRPK